MSTRQTWGQIRFGYLAGFIWFVDFILYILYMLDVVDSIEFQLLSWFIILALGSFVFAWAFIPKQPDFGLSAGDKDTIITFTLMGFVIAFLFQMALQLVATLQFKFSVLETDTYELFLGITAAINEEVFRWSALLFLGYALPRVQFLPQTIYGMGSPAIIVGVIVNTIWTFLHAMSYESAPLLVWVGLWISGAVITVCLYFSGQILVAIAIHALWNIAVVLKLAAIIFSVLGVG